MPLNAKLKWLQFHVNTGVIQRFRKTLVRRVFYLAHWTCTARYGTYPLTCFWPGDFFCNLEQRFSTMGTFNTFICFTELYFCTALFFYILVFGFCVQLHHILHLGIFALIVLYILEGFNKVVKKLGLLLTWMVPSMLFFSAHYKFHSRGKWPFPTACFVSFTALTSNIT